MFLTEIIVCQDYQFIDLQINDFVYLSNLDRIYFVGSKAGNYKDSLCVMNPENGNIEHCYSIPDDPDIMTLSNDDQFIYIGLRGQPKLVRFNVQDEEVDLDIWTGQGPPGFGFLYPQDIEVFPNDPYSIAVAQQSFYTSSHEGISIYKNGVLQPKFMNTFINGSHNNASITFADNNDFLYGFSGNSSTKINRMILDSEGIEFDTYFENILTIPFAQLKYSDGVIYTSYGEAVKVDPITYLGQFGAGLAAFEIESASDRIFYARESTSNKFEIETYDRTSFELIGIDEIPLTGSDASKSPFKMISIGNNGKFAIILRYAYTGAGNQLFTDTKLVLVKDVAVSSTTIKRESSKISIFPNPTMNEVNVHFQSSFQGKEVLIRLFNSLGKEINSWDSINPTATFKLSLYDYARGIYFLQVKNKDNGKITVKKILKN
jgi:hypothetical protein